MTTSPSDGPWRQRPILWSFTDQTLIGHMMTVLVGIGVFAATYALWLEMVAGDLSLLISSQPDAVTARLTGLRVATIACYIWFSVAFMFGKGGPLRNFWLYPLLSIFAGRDLLPLVIFGQRADNPIGDVGFTFASPDLVSTTIWFFLPGFLVGLVLAFGFIAVLTYVVDGEDEWIDRHLPEEYAYFQEMDRQKYGTDDSE